MICQKKIGACPHGVAGAGNIMGCWGRRRRWGVNVKESYGDKSDGTVLKGRCHKIP